jgi:hypothetical protein
MTSLRLPSSTLCVCSLPTSTLCVCSVPASTGHRTTVRSHHDWSSLFHALRMFSPLVHALRMFCTSVHWSSCNGPFPSRLELPLPRSAFVLSPRPRSAYVLYQRPLVIVQRSVPITTGAPSSTLCVCSLPSSTLCVCSVPASTGHRATVRFHHDWSSPHHLLTISLDLQARKQTSTQPTIQPSILS